MAPTKPPATSSGPNLPTPVKALIGVVAFLVVGLGYFIAFYGDLEGQLTSEKSRESNLRSELVKAEESAKAYQKDLEEKTRREKLALEQKKILPDEAETPAFLSAIQGVATVSGVNLLSYTPRDEVPQQFYAKVPMELTMSGRFHQIARFFYGVGKLDRIINVEDIEMITRKKSGRDETDEVVLDVKCLATAFRAVNGSETTAAGRKRGK